MFSLQFVPMMIFVSIWHLVVYCPMAHSNWHYQGFIKNIGALDFAGGNVVHICSGASGLAVVIVLGNRKGRDDLFLFFVISPWCNIFPPWGLFVTPLAYLVQSSSTHHFFIVLFFPSSFVQVSARKAMIPIISY